MTSSQTEILGKVRRAQQEQLDAADAQLALAEIGSAPEAPLDSDDPEENFFLRLIRNNVSFDIAHSRGDVVQLISEFLYKEHNTRKVVAGHDPRLAAMPWRDGGVLVRFGIASPVEDKVSISFAKLAIAESGTLVLFAGRDNPASNNWLVEDHLVIVDARDLVTSYEVAWPKIRDQAGDQLPRGVNFISGPSSTADIAMNVVVGAHGPQRLKVIYLGRPEPEAVDRARELAQQVKV